MTRMNDASPAGSNSNEADVLVPRTKETLGAYVANPLAGLDLSDVTDNVMGPALGIGSTILGTLFVKKVLAPHLPTKLGKFAPLLSGVVAAIATAPLMWWKKDVGLQAAGTALMLGVSLQLMDHFGGALPVGGYTARRVGAYTAEQVGALPAGMYSNVRAEALPGSVNAALSNKAYGKMGNAYGTAYGQYVG